MNKRTFLMSALSVTTLGATVPAAAAEAAFPSQALKIIVATPSGGASDTAARLLAQALAKNLGQPVIVENKPGGNGVPAIQTALSAPADGHTLLWAQASMTGLPLLVKASPIRSIREFTPVVVAVQVVYGLLVNPKVPAASVDEFTAYLKANPDRSNYGTGVLSEYLLTVQYLRAIGAKAVRVPYKGGAQLMPDLISGEIQFNLGPLAPALPHVRSGRLRLLATLPDRNVAAPGVPSLAESGVAADAALAWNGLVAPPGTPREVAARLAQEVNSALAQPALRSALEAQGLRVAGGTPAQMEQAMDAAAAAWGQFVREYDIPQE